MRQNVARFLAPLTLFEWGGILTYFYFSHRLTAFLHPSFRPLVLVTGFLLLFTALCLLFGGKDEEFHSARDCGQFDCDASHARLTFGGLFAFLVLLVPIALAVKISPDGYSTVLIENRGAAESLESVPESRSRAVPSPTPVYVGVDNFAEPPLPQNPEAAPQEYPALTGDIPKGWVPPNAPEFSESKTVPDDDDYPSNDALAAKLRAGSNVSIPEAQKLPKAPSGKAAPLAALNERAPTAETPLGTLKDVLKMADSPLNDEGGGSLNAGPGGRAVALEVVDLLIAAQKPAAMKELSGKRVEFTGQILPAEGHNFRLLRLLVLCCAADAQPLAVRVETHDGKSLPSMAWAKVTGKVAFVKKGHGSVPVVTAEEVSLIKKPNEPYLY